MKKFIGVKEISAEAEMKDGKDGYKVVYPDGYTSWSPKDVFEEAYTEVEEDNRQMRQSVSDIVAEVNKEQGMFLPQGYLWGMLKRMELRGFTFDKAK